MNPSLFTTGVELLDQGRFHVISSKGDKTYLVDLAEWQCNGACSCPNFRFRIAPKLARLKPGEAHAPMRCRHLHAARAYAADLYTAGLSQQEDGP